MQEQDWEEVIHIGGNNQINCHVKIGPFVLSKKIYEHCGAKNYPYDVATNKYPQN